MPTAKFCFHCEEKVISCCKIDPGKYKIKIVSNLQLYLIYPNLFGICICNGSEKDM